MNFIFIFLFLTKKISFWSLFSFNSKKVSIKFWYLELFDYLCGGIGREIPNHRCISLLFRTLPKRRRKSVLE